MINKKALTVVGAILCVGVAVYSVIYLVGVNADAKINKEREVSKKLALEIAELQGTVKIRDSNILKLDAELLSATQDLDEAREIVKNLKKEKVIIKSSTAEEACNKIAELYGDSTSKIVQDGITIKLPTTTQILYDAESFIKNYPIKVAESNANLNAYTKANFALQISEAANGERQLKINDLNTIIVKKDGIILSKDSEIRSFETKLKVAKATSTLEKVAIGVGMFAVGYFAKDKLKR